MMQIQPMEFTDFSKKFNQTSSEFILKELFGIEISPNVHKDLVILYMIYLLHQKLQPTITYTNTIFKGEPI